MSNLQHSPEEVWKDISGYNGNYQISNLGRVKSVKSDMILKPHKNNNGYWLVWIGRDRYTIHRLVAWHFLKPAQQSLEVHHLDGNKDNNSASNLKWVTKSENIQAAANDERNRMKGIRHVYSKQIIHKPTGKIYGSISEAAREVGCSMVYISLQMRGKRKNTLGFEYL